MHSLSPHTYLLNNLHLIQITTKDAIQIDQVIAYMVLQQRLFTYTVYSIEIDDYQHSAGMKCRFNSFRERKTKSPNKIIKLASKLFYNICYFRQSSARKVNSILQQLILARGNKIWVPSVKIFQLTSVSLCKYNPI